MRKIIVKILNFIFNRGNKHPYLVEIGVHSYPDNHWGGINEYGIFSSLKSLLGEERVKRRTKVDPRDCWELESVFYMWLYEHLCQLLNDTIVNLEFRTFEHNGKTYTEGEYIKYLRDLCKQMILFDELEGCPELEIDEESWESDSHTIKWKNSEEELALHTKKMEENFKKNEATRKELCEVFCDLLPHLWW